MSRSGTAAFAINYTTADGTATAGSDYVATSGTLTFAAGEVSKTITVAINGDTAIEDHETFFVNLSGATNGGIIVNPQGIGTIRDEDGVGEISISDVQLTEGDSGTQTATFTVSRTGPAPFAIDYATANNSATAGSDYVATSGTLTFAANEASKEISVTVNGDTEIEGNSYAEWFWVNLSGATNGGTEQSPRRCARPSTRRPLTGVTLEPPLPLVVWPRMSRTLNSSAWRRRRPNTGPS